MTDVEALRAHGYITDSDSDSGKSEFDEEYYQNKPPPIWIHPSQIVFIRKMNVEPNTNSNYVNNINSIYYHNDIIQPAQTRSTYNIGIHESSHYFAQLGTDQYSHHQGIAMNSEYEMNESPISKTVLHQEEDKQRQKRILSYMDDADNNADLEALIKTNKTEVMSIVPSGPKQSDSKNTRNICDSISIISSAPSLVPDHPVLTTKYLNTNLAPQIPDHNSKINNEEGFWDYWFRCLACCF